MTWSFALLGKTREKGDGLLKLKGISYCKKRRAYGSWEFPLENVTYIPKLEMLLDHVQMVGEKAVSYISMACSKHLNNECIPASK
jgi:hypothetical protein